MKTITNKKAPLLLSIAVTLLITANKDALAEEPSSQSLQLVYNYKLINNANLKNGLAAINNHHNINNSKVIKYAKWKNDYKKPLIKKIGKIKKNKSFSI